MTSVDTGYEARLRGVLKQGAPQAPSFTMGTGFPTVGIFGSSDTTGFFGKIAPYLIYALLVTFVILLILVIVHYTVKPIFNFGDNPNALINLRAPDWKKSWEDSTKTHKHIPANAIISKNNFSFIVDVNVTDITPSPQTGNVFVLAYKTLGEVFTEGESNDTRTMTVAVKGDDKKEYKAEILRDFPYLVNAQTPNPATKPSLTLAYDSVAGKIKVYYVVTDGTTPYLHNVSASISPKQTYRVAVVVSDLNVELYLNGQYAASKIYPGKTIFGTNTDMLICSPGIYSSNVRVGNAFIINRVVTSGEIRSMAGPSTIKLD
jgi:hypothetical protein